MHRMVIIGAGPSGISMAAEAIEAGVNSRDIVVLERAPEHSWTIRKYYPESKPVAASYKGRDAVCRGVLCIEDTTKDGFLSYLGSVIRRYGIQVHHGVAVTSVGRGEDGILRVSTDRGVYEAPVCVIAIGVLGRPHRPDYPIPGAVRKKVLFDVTSEEIVGSDVLVVGGGDSASEYAQLLAERGNRVTLSYRRREFTRMNPINRDSVLALERSGQLRILRESDIASLEKDGDRVRVVFRTGELEPFSVDRIVYALGGTTPTNFLRAAGIELQDEAELAAHGFETRIPGLFLVGDLSAGRSGGSISSAFESARVAMERVSSRHPRAVSE